MDLKKCFIVRPNIRRQINRAVKSSLGCRVIWHGRTSDGDDFGELTKTINVSSARADGLRMMGVTFLLHEQPSETKEAHP